MKIIFFYLIFLVFTHQTFAQSVNDSGYLTDKTTGCKIYTTSLKGKDGRWAGNCKNGFADGNGVLKFDLNGMPFGTYQVTMTAGKVNGNGEFTLANGTKYEGNIKDNKIHGLGSLTLPDGTKYSGEFSEGYMEDSFGSIIYPNGDLYVGGVRKSKKNGLGMLTLKNGKSYSGEFKDDKETENVKLIDPKDIPIKTKESDLNFFDK